MPNSLKLFQHKISCFLILSTLIAAVSCTKSGTHPSTAAITGFSLVDTINHPQITSQGFIIGNDITIFLPPGTNKSQLVAGFTLSDTTAAVTVNSVAQRSGVTSNDFSQPVTYTVTARSGAIQSFTVELVTDISTIDNNVIGFMNKYNVPALSLAITQDDKLVYAKSYGYSDLEGNVPASNQDRYRLASVSKQITSVTIMKLIDQGKLHMQDRVFGPGAILGTDFGTYPYNPGVTDITIDELLHHTGGGWSNDSPNYGDPLFDHQRMSKAQILSYTLDHLPLDTIPGTHYDYSNFGYFVLGRVIEKVTGQPYADAAKALVLGPSGIVNMRIAGNTLAERAPGEVKYYGQGDEDPYSFNINRMDANGGWIASATDLARFLAHIDGVSQGDIISQTALTTMTTGSAANPNYGCGWILTGPNWWHNGSLPGTYTEQAVTFQSGNFNFVILTNTRNPNSNSYGTDMDNIFWSSVKNMIAWPPYDLFIPVNQGN